MAVSDRLAVLYFYFPSTSVIPSDEQLGLLAIPAIRFNHVVNSVGMDTTFDILLAGQNAYKWQWYDTLRSSEMLSLKPVPPLYSWINERRTPNAPAASPKPYECLLDEIGKLALV